jgi:predicted nucleic acid-binding protein
LKVALDTNVLVYAEGIGDAARRRVALDLIGRLPQESAVIPVQALGELFNVLTRKAGRSRVVARRAILAWRDSFALSGTSAAVMVAASDLVVDHKLSIWDSVILAAAAEGGCRLLLSEGLQEGFTWRGVTVTNPFAGRIHALLDGLLQPRTSRR